MKLSNIIKKYSDIEYIYTRSLEEHPNASGNDYIEGYRNALRHIWSDYTEEPTEEEKDLAARIYSIDIYENRNNDTTPADIAESIRTDPNETIKYLLDYIDEIQA